MQWRIVPLISLLFVGWVVANAASAEDERVIDSFMQLLVGDETSAQVAIEYIDEHWHSGFVPMTLETLSLSGSSALNAGLVALLEKKTRQRWGFELSAWYQWLWNQATTQHAAYADFKSAVYSLIDPVFGGYFSGAGKATIRLDDSL